MTEAARHRYCHECGWEGVHYEAETRHNPGINLDDCPDCGADLEDESREEDDE